MCGMRRKVLRCRATANPKLVAQRPPTRPPQGRARATARPSLSRGPSYAPPAPADHPFRSHPRVDQRGPQRPMARQGRDFRLARRPCARARRRHTAPRRRSPDPQGGVDCPVGHTPPGDPRWNRARSRPRTRWVPLRSGSSSRPPRSCSGGPSRAVAGAAEASPRGPSGRRPCSLASTATRSPCSSRTCSWARCSRLRRGNVLHASRSTGRQVDTAPYPEQPV